MACNANTDVQIHVDLYLPGSKRFYRALDLFGPINPAESTSQFYATKVRVPGHLQTKLSTYVPG